jgi:hypothetical protein
VDRKHTESLPSSSSFLSPPSSLPPPSSLLLLTPPHQTYIKAFYLPNDELEEWTRKHTEYTVNQRNALINAGEWDINVKKKALRVLNK